MLNLLSYHDRYLFTDIKKVVSCLLGVILITLFSLLAVKKQYSQRATVLCTAIATIKTNVERQRKYIAMHNSDGSELPLSSLVSVIARLLPINSFLITLAFDGDDLVLEGILQARESHIIKQFVSVIEKDIHIATKLIQIKQVATEKWRYDILIRVKH